LLERCLPLANALVNMLAKCGSLRRAREVLESLPARDVVTWTTLMAGYVQHGHGEASLACRGLMHREAISANPRTFSCLFKACGITGACGKGTEIHAAIAEGGIWREDAVLCNALVDMYAKCGAMEKAREAFDRTIAVRNVVTWNALISGYAQDGLGEAAFDAFARMQNESFCPDDMTLSSIFNACGSIPALDKGKKMHAMIFPEIWLKNNNILHNALVDMYAKCGSIAEAKYVFDEVQLRDVISWTSLISGLVRHGHDKEAVDCYEHMRCEGLTPNAITLAYVLKACATSRALDVGKEIHVEIARRGLLGKNSELGNALVDMYAKCGALAKAEQVFDDLPIRDATSSTALISGYHEYGHNEEALKCFNRMHAEGISPDIVTFLCILKVCGSIGAAEKGKEMHDEIIREGFLAKERALIAPALIDMYSKCGILTKAQEVFDELRIRDVISWTALISGYAQDGRHDVCFDLFHKMGEEKDMVPDLVTFTVLLNICCFSGLVSEGRMFFETMITCYGIIPTPEHYTCMVDLYCRVGHFDEAIRIMQEMPSSDYLPAWFALLSACQKWGNVKLGNVAFEQAVRLHQRSNVPYRCKNNSLLREL
jgi:pentatricopeptide repeat protein